VRQSAANAAEGAGALRILKIRTADWPERERLAMFRDNVGRDQVIVEPLDGEPFRIDATLAKLPGLGLVSAKRSPLRSHFRDGDDRFTINLGGDALASQGGREFVLKSGDAVAFMGEDPGTIATGARGRLATIEFERGSLQRLVRGRASSGVGRVPARTPALLLLRRYLNAIWAFDLLRTGVIRPLAIEHIHDLAAVALGAGREAEEIAKSRGVRAARLQAIREDVLSRLEGELSLGEVAARHRVSTRYVAMLFESEGTSFTSFVRDERLERARRMLVNAVRGHRLVSEIAYQVGFNDLSYFNRSFRRRFGVSPGEMRELSRREA
jgi:AraC-like DNA-binding protein